MSSLAADLPHIDEHSMAIAASPEAVWPALLRTVETSVGTGAAPTMARLLGCEDTVAGGPRPIEQGSVLPGFHIATAIASTELGLAGRHRFSRYALIFRLEPLAGEQTLLRAETRAEFPQLKGAIYKGLVIGTRGHVLVTRRILTGVKRRAER